MKFLADIQTSPILRESVNGIKDCDDSFKTQMNFFRKQADNIVKDYQTRRDQFWANIEEEMKKHDLLPKDYSKGRYKIHFNEDRTQLFVSRVEEDDDIENLLKRIISGISK